jgi:PAS domain S-box-containing protein
MVLRTREVLERLSKKWVMAIAVALVGLTGAIDHVTGVELQVAILYLIPVALASWYVSQGAGLIIGTISSLVWLIADLTAGHVNANPLFVIWNATIFLCFFLLVVILLARIQDTLYRLKREVRQRLEAEVELARSEELYRTLVETAGDLMWAVDLDLNFTFISPSVTKLPGYTVREMLASSPQEGLTPDSRNKVIRMFREELEKETPNPRARHVSHSVEVERYHKDGTPRCMQFTATFLRNPQGLPTGVLGISRDITERKKA